MQRRYINPQWATAYDDRTGNTNNFATAIDSHVNPKQIWSNKASCIHATSSDSGRHFCAEYQDGDQELEVVIT